MLRMSLRTICTTLASATLYFCTSPAVADYTRVTFTATIGGVTDTGGGTFSGVGVGATVTGEFRYGTSAAEATSIDPADYDTEYYFDGTNHGASFSSGTTSSGGDAVWVDIEDNFPADADETVPILNEIFGLNVSVGDPLDVWALYAESPGTFWDDENDCLVNGLQFELLLLDADGTMFDDQSFRAQPPAPGDIELAAFFIEEASGTTECNTTSAAYGTITDIQYELAVATEAKSKAMPWLNLLLEE